MIASLRGALQQRGLDHVVVDVGGVGYKLLISTQTLAGLPGVGEEVALLCHTHVREDALQLYGFLAAEERYAFEQLIGVSGVGPRLALTVLSGLSFEQLVASIAGGDHRKLQGIPGIGKKTAERLVVELKDRFAELPAAAEPAERRERARAPREVLEALINLGYKRAEAERAVQRVSEREGAGDLSPEEVLRRALAAIAEAP